jgi:5-methyltetrahydropteroyltriglutamate--homocysteine methyltransferase
MPVMRVDPVGSLLRPAYLKDAFRRFAQREMAEAELRATEARAIREVVRRQESIEYRRLNWQVSF